MRDEAGERESRYTAEATAECNPEVLRHNDS
jgi:hypothetical protein